jgi:hypothetical protein
VRFFFLGVIRDVVVELLVELCLMKCATELEQVKVGGTQLLRTGVDREVHDVVPDVAGAHQPAPLLVVEGDSADGQSLERRLKTYGQSTRLVDVGQDQNLVFEDQSRLQQEFDRLGDVDIANRQDLGCSSVKPASRRDSFRNS